jgi:hypothetical protein
MDILLELLGQSGSGSNVFWLGGFVATAQHDDQQRTLLQVLHAPAGAKELAHFPHATAHGLYIAQVAQLGLAQAQRQTTIQSAIRALHATVLGGNHSPGVQTALAVEALQAASCLPAG